MLCFPAVLFSGAVLPVPTMAFAGRLISAVTSDRWAFESTGRALGLDGLLAHDPSGRGLEVLAEQKDAFAAQQLGHWAILVAFAVVFLGWPAKKLGPPKRVSFRDKTHRDAFGQPFWRS
mgnify:CR=1 FL=1